MAKTMVRIKNNVVINVEWWNEEKPETNTLIDPCDRLVCIGDIYNNGEFYRNGEKVLTETEMLEALMEELESENLEELNDELVVE